MTDTEKTTTPEFIRYVKERDEAREEVRVAKEEIKSLQCQLYDALSKTDALEKKVAETTKLSSKKPDSKKTTKKVNSTSNTQPASNKSKPTAAVVPAIHSDAKCDVYHPPVPMATKYSCCSEYYKKLTEKLPNLPMGQVLDAEKKFIVADVDMSGTIDKDELDQVLTKTVTMFTGPQLDEIFKAVDTDKSNAVDFYECLVILDKLVSRRTTNLPHTVKENYSKTCSIQ